MIERFRRKREETANALSLPEEVQWRGWLISLAFIFVFDRIENRFHFLLPYGGIIYLIAVVYVACWMGLRTSLGSCAILVAYVWLIYRYPISAVAKDPKMATLAVTITAIFYPSFALIGGLVNNKIRKSYAREFVARQAADTEAQQRRIVEAELWASEEMRRVIVNSSADAIVGMNKDGFISLWNPNAELLFGWSQAEAIGEKASRRVVSGGPANDLGIQLSSFLESGEDPPLRQSHEIAIRTKSGNTVDIEFYIADHRTPKGSIYIIFARNIADRKRSEQAIKELNASLEDRVLERTNQLESANHRLEEANKELVGFTYTVSHDLRSPLRSIVSNSRIVCEEAEGILGDEAMERLKRLETSALKMADLIDNLLRYARLSHVPLVAKEVDLSAMAIRIGSALNERKRGSVDVQPGMVVHGDPEMVELVLFNLLENAWKYVRPDQTPFVEVGRRSDGVFFVRDQGIGFDMQYVDKIWEPFERLHRDSEYPGTGIGLANSKRIVERHGGKIWTESALGLGTTMYFALDDQARILSSER